MAEGATKTCMFCSADVTNAPRMKDAQGRYACKACADKKMAEGKAKGGAAGPAAATVAVPSAVANYDLAPSAGMDLADIAKTIKGSVQNSKQCPSCSAFIPQEAVICVTCGHNTLTGKAAKTKIEKALVNKETGGGRRRTRSVDPETVLSIIAMTSIAVGLIGVGIGLMMDEEIALGIGGIALAVGALIVHVGTSVIAGSQDGLLWGLAVFFVPIAGIYWCLTSCENTFLKITYPILALISIGMRFAAKADRVRDSSLEDSGGALPLVWVMPHGWDQGAVGYAGLPTSA